MKEKVGIYFMKIILSNEKIAQNRLLFYMFNPILIYPLWNLQKTRVRK